MTPSKWLQWTYNYNGGVVIADGILYKVVWAPNTLAEQLLGQKVAFPETESPGVVVDGDSIAPLSDKEVAAIKAESFPDDDGWAKREAELDAQYEKEAAEAVASATFQTLPVITAPDAAATYLKPPRSEKEVQNLLAVREIPNIVQLVGRTEDKLVMVHAGVTINNLFRNGAIGPSMQRRIASQIAAALVSLHNAGLHHRDVTTHNILVSGDAATLCDLESGPISLHIRAPEVILQDAYTDKADDAYTDKADVFAFGIFLWSLQNNNVPRPFNFGLLDITGQFAPAIEQCLQFQPSQRPTMAEVAKELPL